MLFFIAAVIGCVILLVLAVASLAIPVVGILLALVLGLAFFAALIVTGIGFSAAFQLLPAIVAENQDGAWTNVRNAFQFAWKYKLQTTGFVVLIVLAQYALGQLGMAAFPNLALVLLLGMLAELLLQTWVGLYAAEFYFQYNGKPGPAPTAPISTAKETKPPAKLEGKPETKKTQKHPTRKDSPKK